MNHEPAFGCRWAVIREKQEEDPPIMAEDDEGSFVLYEHFAHLQQQLAAMTRERDELKYRLQVMADTVGEENFSLRQQLSASQARCRDREREIETLTTCGCEGCDDNLEESAFCFPCMNKVQQQVTQLQATLAAREATIKSIADSLTGAERIDAIAKAIAANSKAVQESKRLRLTWTTEKPTKAGLYFKRSPIVCAEPEIVQVSHENETGGLIWSNFDTEWDWIERPDSTYDWAGPIPLPTEAQQARGSSGGAANHGAGA